jgi:hypothetical protein
MWITPSQLKYSGFDSPVPIVYINGDPQNATVPDSITFDADVTTMTEPLKTIDVAPKHFVDTQSICTDPILRFATELDAESISMLPPKMKNEPPTRFTSPTPDEVSEPAPIPDPPDPETLIQPPVIETTPTGPKPNPPLIPVLFQIGLK